MRTLVHLSDLHFGRADDEIVAALGDEVRRASPDVIAISGDLTQRARREQFVQARSFLESLPAPYLVVPGNHDVPLYNVASRLLNPLGGYRRHITGNLTPVHADEEILVIGANTTRSLRVKSGTLRRSDLDRICGALEGRTEQTVKIVVAHHPFDAPHAVETLTGAGADVFLTGHLHVSYSGHTAARYQCGGRSAIVVEAGTATSTRLRGEPNAFNVLHVDPAQVVVERCEWYAAERRFTTVDSETFVRGADGWRLEV